MDRFELSFYGTATIIMGLASLFILGGMLIYTSLYRKRGNTEDKLFFALILTNIAAALFDQSRSDRKQRNHNRNCLDQQHHCHGSCGDDGPDRILSLCLTA